MNAAVRRRQNEQDARHRVGVPHDRWGEAGLAVLVRKADQTLDEAEVIRHCRGQLARFKVPRRFVFVDEIPKGPSGKLQRIGLAKTLGLT